MANDGSDEDATSLSRYRRALGRIPVAIGVAAGERKVRPVLGALRAGIVRTLVTDVATAEAVVRLDAATISPTDGGRPR